MADDPVLRQRLYIRYKQRAYRQKIVSEIATLKAEAKDLERHVARLMVKRGSLLSWKDVAQGLALETAASKQTTAALQAKRKAYLDVVAAMTNWIVLQRGVQKAPATTPTWRNTTLLADPVTRKLGFDWITKRSLAQTDQMLHAWCFPAPSSPESVLDFAVDSTDADCLQYVLRCQQVLPAPLEFVVPAIRDHVVQFLVGALWDYEDREMRERVAEPLDTQLLQEATDRMTYSRNVLTSEETIHYLTREFHSDRRVTIVGQNIHDDECLPGSQRQCNRSFWFVLDRLGPCRTLLRVLYVTSHYFTTDGYVSLDNEARYWGCDLAGTPEAKKAVAFYQHAATVGTEFARLGARQIARGFAT
ncbi:hypothetical protein ACHHYP_05294 [Achlya hypogyna]|uniref:Uncharacterized protein n=1 Tax=Achlya hypogyna TaxID=1202772 RepID=A0A1V9YYE6_ACHHY|nr:hypothetical protein ACHHYP_05294 [Achlya hypogyna]